MDREDWNEILDECLRDESDTMSAWEVEFVESLNSQRERGDDQGGDFEPSQKQWKVLCRIWEKLYR